MNKITFSKLVFFAGVMLLMASCATNRAYETMILGKWKPMKVEKYIDSTAIQAAMASKAKTKETNEKSGQIGENPSPSKFTDALNKALQVETKAMMEVFPDKTVVKNYLQKDVKATWKMNRKGTCMKVTNVDNGRKYTIDLLEVSKEKVVLLEHLMIGDIKITYVRMDHPTE